MRFPLNLVRYQTPPESSKYGIVNSLLSDVPLPSQVWLQQDDWGGVEYLLPACSQPLTSYPAGCAPGSVKPPFQRLFRGSGQDVPNWFVARYDCATLTQNGLNPLDTTEIDLLYHGDFEIQVEAEYTPKISLGATNLGAATSVICAYERALAASVAGPGSPVPVLFVDSLVGSVLVSRHFVEEKNGKLYDRLTGGLVVVLRSGTNGSVFAAQDLRGGLWTSEPILLPDDYSEDAIRDTNTRLYTYEKAFLTVAVACHTFKSDYDCSLGIF